MTATATRTAIWLRIFCAILLLSLGFGHKPLHAKPSSDPASSFYLLPDGTYADLCIESVDHGKPEKSGKAQRLDLRTDQLQRPAENLGTHVDAEHRLRARPRAL